VEGAAAADPARSQEGDPGMENRVDPDRYSRLDHRAGRFEHGDPGEHQGFQVAVEEPAVDLRQLAPVVDSQGLLGVGERQEAEGISVGRGVGQGVGQVELPWAFCGERRER